MFEDKRKEGKCERTNDFVGAEPSDGAFGRNGEESKASAFARILSVLAQPLRQAGKPQHDICGQLQKSVSASLRVRARARARACAFV